MVMDRVSTPGGAISEAGDRERGARRAGATSAARSSSEGLIDGSPAERRVIYFEDLEVGKETYFGSYEVTREEVLEFARKYDPQPFHLSDEAAAKTYFGRLVGERLAHLRDGDGR